MLAWLQRAEIGRAETGRVETERVETERAETERAEIENYLVSWSFTDRVFGVRAHCLDGCMVASSMINDCRPSSCNPQQYQGHNHQRC